MRESDDNVDSGRAPRSFVDGRHFSTSLLSDECYREDTGDAVQIEYYWVQKRDASLTRRR